jgi:hypothetical protein
LALVITSQGALPQIFGMFKSRFDKLMHLSLSSGIAMISVDAAAFDGQCAETANLGMRARRHDSDVKQFASGIV